MLILKRPWTRQPQYAVKAKSNGFKYLMYGRQWGGVTGNIWTPSNTPGTAIGVAGTATSFTRASSQKLLTPVSNVSSNNLTLYALLRRTEIDTGKNYTVMSLATASGNQRSVLYFASSAGITKLAWFLGAGSTYRQTMCADNSWQNTTEYVPCIARTWNSSSGFDCAFSLGGVIYTSSITTSNTVTPANPTSLAIGSNYVDGSDVANFFLSADVAAAGLIPYAISDLEVRALLNNPNGWAQWLEPQQIKIPTAAAAASSLPILSLPTYVTGSITATGARGRVTATAP